MRRINNAEVKKLVLGGSKQLPAIGKDRLKLPYFSLLICAKKNSGKTVLVNDILKNCTDQKTRVVIFSATHERDKTWVTIKNRLEKRGLEVEAYENFIDEDKNNILNEIVNDLRPLAEEEEEDEEDDSEEDVMDEDEFDWCQTMGKQGIEFPKRKIPKKAKPKKAKPKHSAPKIVFVFDDLTKKDLRHKSISGFIKRHRHFGAGFIVSTHNIQSLEPTSRSQFDYFIFFKGIAEDRLKTVHNETQCRVPFETFLNMYESCIKEKYNFFFYDTNGDGEYRKNWNTLLDPSKF